MVWLIHKLIYCEAKLSGYFVTIPKATAASRKSVLTFTLRILTSHDEKRMK